MPATFIFTKFTPNKLKKLPTLRYQSLIHVGIVDFDGWLPRQPSNNPRNHGGAVLRNSGMDVVNQPTPPPGASLEGVGWGWFTRVLLSLTMQPRKKKSINNGYILVLWLDWSLLPPKQWHYISQAITPGLTSSPVSPPPGPSISGWLLCVSSSIGSCLRPWHDSFYIIFLLSQLSPKQWEDISPHAPTPTHPLSNIPPTPIIDFWLIVVCFY